MAVLTNNTTVYGCRLYIYQYKVIISSPERYIGPERATEDRFIVQPRHILHIRPIGTYNLDSRVISDHFRTICYSIPIYRRPQNLLNFVSRCMLVKDYLDKSSYYNAQFKQ